MANKIDIDVLSDIVSEDTLEEYDKARAIVAHIGEAYPALSVDILSKLTMLVALQYDMSEEALEKYMECLRKYMEIGFTLKDEFEQTNQLTKTIH